MVSNGNNVVEAVIEEFFERKALVYVRHIPQRSANVAFQEVLKISR